MSTAMRKKIKTAKEATEEHAIDTATDTNIHSTDTDTLKRCEYKDRYSYRYRYRLRYIVFVYVCIYTDT